MTIETETFNQLLDTIHRYVRDRLIPLERQVDETDRIPDEIVSEMKELGFFGLTIPEAYGGLGLTLKEEIDVIYEFGYTSPAFRSVFGSNIGIGSQAIIIDGTPEQKETYLPRMASGELIGSFCLTEPDVGSDAAALRMTAKRQGDGYVLNGSKRFITNAPRAGAFTVMARTGTVEERAKGVSAFIVDAGCKGLQVGKPDRKMGQKGAHTADVVFDNVKVPASALIGGVEGQGFVTAMKVLNRARLSISALSVGAARRLIDESLQYTMQRKQFGTEIANHQLIQAMLADSETEYYAAKCMVNDAAGRTGNTAEVAKLASCCKLYCTEMVGRVADRAVQMFGGAGYISEYGIERMYRDVRLLRLYEGTSQIQQIAIARSMIKEAKALS
ncbi:MAG: acyl-CoA dehydrogenase family protein [Alphaproteobacteria bacterium]